MHPFRKLLLISLGKETSFAKTPSRADWVTLHRAARHQTLLGVLYDAAAGLPEEQRPPEEMLAEWKSSAEKIAAVHARHCREAEEIARMLSEVGLEGILLKGTGLAALYPAPSKRMCGDIDVWVRKPRNETLEALRGRWRVHGVLYQECKASMLPGTVVEIHFHPTKMCNPFLNARLQRTLERLAPPTQAGTLAVPGAEFNAVFCLAHMLRHYLESGLGLRQMMDYNYVLKTLPEERRESVIETVKRLGMKKFAAGTMYVLQRAFGLEDGYLLCPADPSMGKRMMEEILRKGNFGVRDSSSRGHAGESGWRRFLRKNRRTLRHLRDCPREVVWSPASRVVQFLWKKTKKKLYRSYENCNFAL